MDWLDLLVVQGTLKSLLQHHSSKASVYLCSAFFTVQILYPYMTTQKSPKCSSWMHFPKNDKIISVYSQGKPFNTTVIQVYTQTSNAEETDAVWFYEDLQDLLELTPKKDVLFRIGDWNAKVGGQEIPGVTGNFSLRVQNETRQRLTEFRQKNTLVIANTIFQQHKRQLYTWTSPDGQ